MKLQPLLPLLISSLLLLIPPMGRSTPTLRSSNTSSRVTYNATVYNISKALCAGCAAWAEPLEFLYYHNLVRLAHWELPLAWAPKLAAYAQWWAGQRKADCALQHSFPEGQFALGENIFWGGGDGWRPGDAVQAWASEAKDYSYAENACAPGKQCGHYTQVVWSKTTSVGCARAVCDGGDVFITCNYEPPGNVIGERPF